FMVYNKPPGAIVARKSRGITMPKDLEGKKLGAPARDAAFALWPIFVQTTGIDARKVTVLDVGFAAREPILADGQVDAITGFSFSSYFTLKDRGVPVDDIIVMLMGDHGLKLYSNAIIVNAKFAAENAEAVRGFLRAFLKGLKDTVASPARAIESVLRRNEEAKKEGELERLRMAIRGNILTREVRTNGYGGVDIRRFEQAIAQLDWHTNSRQNQAWRISSIRRFFHLLTNDGSNRRAMSAFGRRAERTSGATQQPPSASSE